MLKTIDNTDDILAQFIFSQKFMEEGTSIKRRKENGIFFTNNINVIDYALGCLPNDATLFSKMILEPSCGQGIFLLKLIFKAYLIKPCPQTISSFIDKKLFFSDLDHNMVKQTEENIAKLYSFLFKQSFDGQFNSFCLDFTLKQELDLFHLPTGIYKYYKKFDYIIGNPPYIALYGRRDKKKSEEQRIYYLNNYNQFPSSLQNGKINYVMLFIEHGIDFLKNSGTLSFIIDVSFFETAYKYCRKYLLNNTKIKRLYFNIQGFEGVASGQIVLTVEKEKIKSHKVLLIDKYNNKESYIDQADWNDENDECKFRIDECKATKSIIIKMQTKYNSTLKQLYPNKNLRTCVMPLDMEEKFTNSHPPQNCDNKFYPYYQGSKGLKSKYSKLTYSKYFIYDKGLQDIINDDLKAELAKKGIKNKKRIGLGETIIYDNPKIFIRQSARELIASYDEAPSASNNSLYVFSLRDNSDDSIRFLKYLCGIINSELYTFFAQRRRIIRFNKGKQPQIKISDLYQINIPSNIQLQKSIAKLVGDIYEKPIEINRLAKEIDTMVYNYYDITEAEILTVKKSIEDFAK